MRLGRWHCSTSVTTHFTGMTLLHHVATMIISLHDLILCNGGIRLICSNMISSKYHNHRHHWCHHCQHHQYTNSTTITTIIIIINKSSTKQVNMLTLVIIINVTTMPPIAASPVTLLHQQLVGISNQVVVTAINILQFHGIDTLTVIIIRTVRNMNIFDHPKWLDVALLHHHHDQLIHHHDHIQRLHHQLYPHYHLHHYLHVLLSLSRQHHPLPQQHRHQSQYQHFHHQMQLEHHHLLMLVVHYYQVHQQHWYWQLHHQLVLLYVRYLNHLMDLYCDVYHFHHLRKRHHQCFSVLHPYKSHNNLHHHHRHRLVHQHQRQRPQR
jgi:hypothetical protein